MLFQAKLIWSQRDDSTVKSVPNYPRLGWTDTWEDESDIEEEENKIAKIDTKRLINVESLTPEEIEKKITDLYQKKDILSPKNIFQLLPFQ